MRQMIDGGQALRIRVEEEGHRLRVYGTFHMSDESSA